jgi:hypothetical protein
MIYFSKFFRIPGPKDLGMSDSNNAMAMEDFRNNDEEYTWEQYEAKIAELFPIRFFFLHTVAYALKYFWWDVSKPFKAAYKWFKCHFIPAHKYHWLDLRTPKDVPAYARYRYGWMDTDHRMEHALFNLLTDFVEKELPNSYCFVPSEEDAAKDDGVDCNYMGFKKQLADHKEYMEIYNWWKVDRHKEHAEYEKALDTWHEAHLGKSQSIKSRVERRKDSQLKELSSRVDELETRNNNKTTDMMIRLIKIRYVMWT